MPSGVYVDVTIAGADDVVAPVDPADDGKVLARNSSTGKYEHVAMSGGGGTSDHAALSNLDYANANHTGFAGTDVTNTFTRKQTFVPSIADLEGSLIPAIDNPDFDTDLSFWTDDATGWGWDTGAAIHTPGQAGTLSQTISVTANFLYYFKLEVSSMTAGSVELFDIFSGDIFVTANGTYETLARVGDSTSDTIFINVSDDFDGRIESVAFSVVSSNLFPSSLSVRDLSNTVSGRFSAAQGGLVIQSDTSINLESGNILLKANSIPTSYDSGNPNRIWSNAGFLFIGDPANIPTSDPGPGGGIWNDGGTLKIA